MRRKRISLKALQTLFFGSFFVVVGVGEALAMSSSEKSMAKLVSKLAEGLAKAQTQRVAILDFPRLNGQVDVVSLIVQERLTTDLVNDGRTQIVERRLMEKMKEEITLGLRGYLDPETASRIGKMLGASALVSGTVTEMRGDRWEVNARAVEVETGKIIVTGRAVIKRDWGELIFMSGAPSLPGVPSVSVVPPPEKNGTERPISFPYVVYTHPRKGQPIKENDAFVSQVAVVSDIPSELVLDLTCVIGESHRNKEPLVDVYFSWGGIWVQGEKRTKVGEGVHRLHLLPEDYFGAETFGFTLVLLDDKENQGHLFINKVPFEKQWLKSTGGHNSDYYEQNVTMKIDAMYPPQPQPGERVTLVGKFGVLEKPYKGQRPRPRKPRVSFLMGNYYSVEVKVKQWASDRIVFKMPKKRGTAENSANDVFGLYVEKYSIWPAEHSNIFLFQLAGATKPIPLP